MCRQKQDAQVLADSAKAMVLLMLKLSQESSLMANWAFFCRFLARALADLDSFRVVGGWYL